MTSRRSTRCPISGRARHAYSRSDLPALPDSLEAALDAFESEEVLRSGLGESFSDYFATSRRWELKAWKETVTDSEPERYERSV